MSDDPNNGENDTPPRSSKRRKVGYRKPPRKHCFRPGQSGNPRGRPKGSKNKPLTVSDERLNDIILEEAFRKVKVSQGARRITMTMMQAAVRTMATQAASGNTRAGRNFLYAVDSVQRRRKAINDEYRDAIANYVREAQQEINRREAKGLPTDGIHPHPDNLRWDHDTAMPYFADEPLPTAEEYRQQLEILDGAVAETEERLKKKLSSEEIKMYRGGLAKLRRHKVFLEGKLKNKPKPV